MSRATISEWLTLLIGLSSLVVSYLAYQNARDTRELKNAISQLSDLALQTKRQADIQGGQLALLKDQRRAVFRQADAAADSAIAAKDVAATARAQTGAILKQADALIRSAQSTVSASNAQLASAQASMRTAEAEANAAQASANAAEQQRVSAEILSASRAPVAQLTSVNLAGWIEHVAHDGIVDVKVEPVISNVGGGTLIPSGGTFNLILSRTIPDTPPKVPQYVMGENEIAVGPGQFYGPSEGFVYHLSETDMAAVDKKEKFIIVWGYEDFRDTANKTHRNCYIYVVKVPTKSGPNGILTPQDAPAYHCNN